MAKATTNTQGITVIPQPAFDKRIQNSLTSPFNSGSTAPNVNPVSPATGTVKGLYRGFMIWDETVMKDQYTGANPPSLRFLFNPSTISASYQITDATAQAALIFPAGNDDAQLRVPLQQQVGFTIMFDRTYELNWASSEPSTLVLNQGCNADVMMLQQLTGQFNQVYQNNNPYYTIQNTVTGATGKSGQSYTNPGANDLGLGISQGVMQLTFLYVYFSYPGYGLEYYGYIDSWDVQFTHFTQSMIPMRCVCDISFTLLPPPTAAPPAANSATVAASQIGGIYPTPGGITPTPIGVTPGLGA